MRGLVRIDFYAYVFGALLLLTLPINWLLAMLAAAVFHELCHVLMISLLGGSVLGIKIGVGGAEIETEPLRPGRELACALAGPFGSLLLVLLCRVFPRLAICAGIQALFNLLPIYPLDGGRALRCGVEMILPKRADGVTRWIELGSVSVIGILAVVGAAVFHLGVAPLLFALVLILRALSRKIPCKRTRIGVQ